MLKSKKDKTVLPSNEEPLASAPVSGKRGPKKGASGIGRPKHYLEPKQSKGVSLTTPSMEFFFNELGGSKGLESLIRGEHEEFVLARVSRLPKKEASDLRLTPKAAEFLNKKLGGAEGLEALLSGQHKSFTLAKLYKV